MKMFRLCCVCFLLSNALADLLFDAEGNLLDDGLAELLSRPKASVLIKHSNTPTHGIVMQQKREIIDQKTILAKDMPKEGASIPDFRKLGPHILQDTFQNQSKNEIPENKEKKSEKEIEHSAKSTTQKIETTSSSMLQVLTPRDTNSSPTIAPTEESTTTMNATIMDATTMNTTTIMTTKTPSDSSSISPILPNGEKAFSSKALRRLIKVRVKKLRKNGEVVLSKIVGKALEDERLMTTTTPQAEMSQRNEKMADPEIPVGEATILDGVYKTGKDQIRKDVMGGVETKKDSTETGSGKKETIVYYPWESFACEDFETEACQQFKPLCSLLDSLAYRKCPKTCGVCKKDNPPNKVFRADFTILQGHVTLTQSCPYSPVFVTACFAKPIADKLQMGLRHRTHSMVIHNYGEISHEGKTCENFGPHYNPHGNQHGDPEESSKHFGDLGPLEFDPVPEDWPKGVETCERDEMGAYGLLDHITLFGEYSPYRLPVVLYSGNAPYQDYSARDALACGRLMPKKAESPTKNPMPDTAVHDNVTTKVQPKK